MLQIENIQLRYGAVQALQGVSFDVNEGEIVSILGANGAGKSTILKAISGLEPLQSGSITFDGKALHGMPAHRIVQLGVCQSPEGRRIFPDCTIEENLQMGGYTLSTKSEVRDGIERAYAHFPLLKERRKQLGSTLSGGEQQMLALARALMSRPRILLLDEPSLGLAPLIVKQIFEIIREINKEGVTILLVEQNANEALQFSDRGYVLETGRILFDGPSQELLKDPRVIEAYLGI